MTPESQRIAIAEACGKLTKTYFCEDKSGDRCIGNREGSSGTYVHDLPDYLNDLNAMNEAEKAFIGDASSAMTFAMYLLRINGQSISTEHDDLNCDHAWIAAHATAAQRAEAFLRTIGKWTTN